MNRFEDDGSAGVTLGAVDESRVEEVLRAFAAALRGHRLYESGSPMRERFVETFRQKLAALWGDLPELSLAIEEDRILWEGESIFPTGGASSDLPFLFYKDGVRSVSLRPGFEESEFEVLLRLLARATRLREDEDDLLTLLWQEDLAYLSYETVEVLPEGAGALSGSGELPESVDPSRVRSAAAESAEITVAAFEDSLYFLDESELRRLREEIRREGERDLWGDVLNGILDRLEDGDEERQTRIVGIVAELLPSTLGMARFDRTAMLLRELVGLAARPGVLAPAAIREVQALFSALGSAETIDQFAAILEESPARLADPAVQRLFEYLPAGAMGPLIRAAERLERPEVRRSFEANVQRLAEGNRDDVLRLLESDDAAVLVGALRWVGRLELVAALPRLAVLLEYREAKVRAAAAGTLAALRAGSAAQGLIPLLGDVDRGVRIAAVRALDDLSYVPARDALEAALDSRRLRETDRSEKIAFFEAYGRLAGPDGVPTLDRILKSRGGWFGRGEPAEIRACAALGLARIRHPAARAALDRASADDDPVVRAAVTRALRGGE